jgi:hypothetical protein
MSVRITRTMVVAEVEVFAGNSVGAVVTDLPAAVTPIDHVSAIGLPPLLQASAGTGVERAGFVGQETSSETA